MIEIKQDFIPAGMRHRPMTYPSSSLYKKTMQAKYITIHNAYWSKDAKALHEYLKSQRCADRPASWHFSIDEKECYQALPLNESGWHSGDNLGPGNTTTIGIEICDYAMLQSPQNKPLFWQACDHAARLCAWLIKEVPSLRPFPECMKQHYDWSGKNCPSWIRAEQGDWQKFVTMVSGYLRGEEKPALKHRVIVGSFTSLENAETMQRQLQLAAPTLLPFIVYNKAGERLLYRVVAAEHDRLDHAEVLADSLKRKGFNNFIISSDDFNDLEMPPELPPPDYDPPDDPGEYEKPPAENEIPSGLLEILKALFDWLKKFFEGKEGQ